MATKSRDYHSPFGDAYGPMLNGPYAPVPSEDVMTDLPVEGRIPEDLNGVYLRNGPNQRFAPQGHYHMFDGDGMIHAAEFRGGNVTYRNKWVRTEGFQEDEKAGRETHWGIHQTVKGRKDRVLADAANTDIIGHAGKAVATWYACGKPHIIDPVTLETVCAATYASWGSGGISAHPKVDGSTGEMMFFDYFESYPFMTYSVINAAGDMTHHVPVALPGDRLPHDMGITQNYSILHDLPVYHDEEALAAGRHKIRFNAQMNARFGVIPRHGSPTEIQWFEFTPCFLYHVVNCREEGDEVVMVACRFMPTRDEAGEIDEERTAKMIAQLGMYARLWEYRMNLKTGVGTEKCLNPDYNIEFPSYDLTHTGRYTQWGYFVDHEASGIHWTGIRKLNTITGECVGAWSDSHEDCWHSEPWFAPADNPKSEDHGYVISFVWNDRTKEQQIQILDALDLNKGPIARIKLPRLVPVGFHGCWMKANQIEGW